MCVGLADLENTVVHVLIVYIIVIGSSNTLAGGYQSCSVCSQLAGCVVTVGSHLPNMLLVIGTRVVSQAISS